MITIRKALPEYLRRKNIEKTTFADFSNRYIRFFDSLSASLTEEQLKDKLSTFLREQFPKEKIAPYHGNQFGGYYSRIDLAMGQDEANPEVIFETKAIGSPDMPGILPDQFNKKALAEILFYYFDLKFNEEKSSVKRLVITDFKNWFILEHTTIDNVFGKDAEKLFEEYKRGNDGHSFLFSSKTENFYTRLQEYLNKHEKKLSQLRDQCLYFSLDKRAGTIKELDKVFTLEFLYCKAVVANHSALDDRFYYEILHLMGLQEKKHEGKKVIQALPEVQKERGSFLEQTLRLLRRRDQEPSFEVALELVITWFNRILFFKLLEAQLVNWHPKDAISYQFFSTRRIKSFSELDGIFLEVLSQPEERRDPFWRDFFLIPFMNSSLFSVSEVEKEHGVFLSALISASITIYKDSVLIDPITGKKYPPNRKKPLLEYLFEFLDSYDFGKHNDGEFSQKTQTVIDPVVLGLLFEKLNGYKDGSYYTPSFITEYMANKSIELGVIEKANEIFGTKTNDRFTTLNDIKDFVGRDKERKEQLTAIIDSFKICDPAVGSGHFLISCLNKLLEMKYSCSLLRTEDGTLLNNLVNLKIENDSLKITDVDTGSDFVYIPNSDLSQQIQEALFKEKRRIIENCLFGVDINPKAVIICRLRLWIELLKNSYYYKDANTTSLILQVMPNLDYNIREGNSLLSMFKVETNETPKYLDELFSVDKNWLNSYKEKITEYKNTFVQKEKRNLEVAIQSLKNKIQISLPQGDEKSLKFFEWAFEFPELLDEDGRFIGFDLVITNPPYIQLQKKDGSLADLYEKRNYETFSRKGDIYWLFFERASQLLKNRGILSFITSNKWTKATEGGVLRNFLSNTNPIDFIDFGGKKIFGNATVDTSILIAQKSINEGHTKALSFPLNHELNELQHIFEEKSVTIDFSRKGEDKWVIVDERGKDLLEKIQSSYGQLSQSNLSINLGIKPGLVAAFIVSTDKKEEILDACSDEEERQKTEKLFVKIIKGRDIGEKDFEWKGTWLINAHNGIKDESGPVEIENYPCVKSYLDSFGDALQKRYDQGDTPYNLRSCEYIKDFTKPKIIYPDISQSTSFVFTNEPIYLDNTAYFIVGKDEDTLRNLAKYLNSKFIKWFIRHVSSQLGSSANRMYKATIEKIPVPEDLTSLQDLEDINEIDNAVAALLGLSEEEKNLVERTFT